MLSLFIATTLAAGPGFPAAYQGRWATNAYQCMGGPEATSLIEIRPREWVGSQDRGTLLRIGAVRGGVHWFSVSNGAHDARAMLGFRRVGPRLEVTMQGGGRTSLQHCRF